MTGVYPDYLKRREHKNMFSLKCAYLFSYNVMEMFRFEFLIMLVGGKKVGFILFISQILCV